MDLTPSELVDIGLDVVDADAGELPGGWRTGSSAPRPPADRPSILVGHQPKPDRAPSPPSSRPPPSCGAARRAHRDDWAGAPTSTDVPPFATSSCTSSGSSVTCSVSWDGEHRSTLRRPEDHFPVLRGAAVRPRGRRGVSHPGLVAERARPDPGVRRARPRPPDRLPRPGRSVRGMLVIRTFELWTHDDDIRRAVGLAANELDDARLGSCRPPCSSHSVSAWPGPVPLGRVAPSASI